MFMRSVTAIYGSEKGMELWDSIATTIGDDLKGDLFFGMMTGKYSMHGVTFVSFTHTNDYVSVIKAVRTASGYGLKEAKDFCDEVRAGKQKVLEVSGNAREVLLRSLSGFGVVAH